MGLPWERCEKELGAWREAEARLPAHCQEASGRSHMDKMTVSLKTDENSKGYVMMMCI